MKKENYTQSDQHKDFCQTNYGIDAYVALYDNTKDDFTNCMLVFSLNVSVAVGLLVAKNIFCLYLTYHRVY